MTKIILILAYLRDHSTGVAERYSKVRFVGTTRMVGPHTPLIFPWLQFSTEPALSSKALHQYSQCLHHGHSHVERLSGVFLRLKWLPDTIWMPDVCPDERPLSLLFISCWCGHWQCLVYQEQHGTGTCISYGHAVGYKMTCWWTLWY